MYRCIYIFADKHTQHKSICIENIIVDAGEDACVSVSSLTYGHIINIYGKQYNTPTIIIIIKGKFNVESVTFKSRMKRKTTKTAEPFIRAIVVASIQTNK